MLNSINYLIKNYTIDTVSGDRRAVFALIEDNNIFNLLVEHVNNKLNINIKWLISGSLEITICFGSVNLIISSLPEKLLDYFQIGSLGLMFYNADNKFLGYISWPK